jgi:hypothetical protein
MKTSILKAIAVLVFVCLMLEFTPPLFQNTRLLWNNPNSFSVRHNFYFGKRQWLADARTIVAGIRYLYQARSAGATNSVHEATSPQRLPTQLGIDTNLMVIGRTESVILLDRGGVRELLLSS